MGLKRRTKRHHNNTPICFAHLSGCSTNHLGLGLGLGLWVRPFFCVLRNDGYPKFLGDAGRWGKNMGYEVGGLQLHK